MTLLAIGDSNLEPSRTDSREGRFPRYNPYNVVPTVAKQLGHNFRCWAKGGASNHWMLDHVNYLLDNIDEFKDPIVMVGWSQWERSEWEWNGSSLSLSIDPYYEIPDELQEKYQKWRDGITPDVVGVQRQIWHDIVYQVHLKLQNLKIPHIFWSTYDNFVGDSIQNKKDWNNCFFKPYEPNGCMKEWFKLQNIPSIPGDPWHWSVDGHEAWGKNLANFFKIHQS